MVAARDNAYISNFTANLKKDSELLQESDDRGVVKETAIAGAA